MHQQPHSPYIPATSNIPEATPTAFVVGILIAVVMTAANTYLGLYSGMTVSASVPASVLGMTIMRGLLRRGTVLEGNIIQTISGAGVSIASGLIFTVSSLVIVGVWKDFKFWPTTLIGVCGGVLGVVCMIPLRRALIVEDTTINYPEGVACAQVLIAGDRGGKSWMHILVGLAVGGALKFFNSGCALLREVSETAFVLGNRVFAIGSDVSPALIAIGYIVHLEVAGLIAAGGLGAWLLCIPMLGIPADFGDLPSLDLAYKLWSTKVRYIGVGTMIVGGLSSMYSVRRGIVSGLKSIAGLGESAASRDEILRTERNLPLSVLAPLFVLCLLLAAALSYWVSGSIKTTVLATGLIAIAGFFFTAVSSYIVGLVGNSNNPVSGMTICTLLAASLLFLALGYQGTEAIVATLCIAAIVCCAACTAGDISQDLKTGYIIGSTPSRQQFAEIVGCLIPALTIAPVLTLLHQTYGIGTGLKAPQANLFASIASAFFGGGKLPIDMVVTGAGIGFALILLNVVFVKMGLRFRAHLMPVAVGIYLPVSLAVPILLGGVARYLVSRKKEGFPRADDLENTEGSDTGTLLASGLIAGEAIMGIVVALLVNIGLSKSMAIGEALPGMLRDLLSIGVLVGIPLCLISAGRRARAFS